MKKFALAAVAAAALSAGVAQAYTVGSFSNGFVVPNVIHNGAANTTAVGIINQSAITVPVYWTWFDQNSMHGVDGCIPMTAQQYFGFNWSAFSGANMEGKRGYLVFAVGQGTTAASTPATACAQGQAAGNQLQVNGPLAQISGNAFYVDVAGKSVAFTPVIDGPLGLNPATSNLSTMGPTSLQTVGGAASATSTMTMSMRYYIDGAAGGNDTRITVWSTGDHSGTHTVNIFDDKQNRQSVNFKLTESELSWFDPETIPGRPSAFVDGFIEWAPAKAQPADFKSIVGEVSLAALANATPPAPGSVVTYSTIIAPAFGAVQTLLGSHR